MPRPELSTLRYPNLWQGCVGAWCPSQSGATGYRLFDDSGNNNHGTLTNMDPGTDWVPSGGKLALDFDGVNDYVLGSCSGIDAFPFSLSIWVKYRYGVNDHQIDFAIGSDFNKYFGLGNFQNATNTKPYLYARNTAFSGVGASSNLSYETWNHVCGLFISDTKKDLYINGQYAVSFTDSVAFVKPTTFRLGNPLQLVFVTKSQQDDIRIYNRALAPYEILQLASSRGAAYERSRGRKKAYVPGYRITAPSRIQTGSARTIDGTDTESLSRGLVGAWCPSLGASGYRLLDRSGNNNHGTLTNMDPGTDWVPSGGKLALDFDGVDDSVNTSLLMRSIPFDTTVSCWAYPYRSATTSERGFLWGGAVAGLLSFDFQIFTDNNIYVGWLASGNDRRIVLSKTASGWTQNQWQHFTFVSSTRFGSILYRNGIQVGSNANANFVAGFTTQTLEIGSNTVVSSFKAFFGQIDDVRIYNRALTPSEIRLLYTGGRGVGLLPESKPKRARIVAWDNTDKISVPARVLTNTDSLKRGLVGHWSPSLSGPQGNRLMDLSGQNNHGTLTNMDYQTDYVPSTDKGGRMALDFDGVNDYAEFSDNQSLNITSAITLTCWVYSRANSSYQAICTKRNGNNGAGTQYGISKTNLNKIGFMYGGGYRELSSTSDIPTNAWVHVAVSYVSSSLSCMFFLNGFLDRMTTGAVALSTQTGGVNIGRNNDSGYPEYFSGQIDDVRIYNRVLTPQEIRLLAQSRMPERATPQRTRMAYWSSGLVSYLRRRTYNSILGSGVIS